VSASSAKQYSAIAEKYKLSTKRLFNADRYMTILREWAHLSRADTILDIGCGEGTFTNFLGEEFLGSGKMIGIDASKEMVELARVEYPHIDFRVEVMDELSLDDCTVDFVFSRYVVHYSENLTRTLGEVARVTKRGGRFFIKDVHPFYAMFLKDSHDYAKKENVAFRAQQDDEIVVVHPSFTMEEYANAFTAAGWRLESMHEVYGREGGGPRVAPYKVPTSVCFVLVKR